MTPPQPVVVEQATGCPWLLFWIAVIASFIVAWNFFPQPKFIANWFKKK
jgi:hypothetical protein